MFQIFKIKKVKNNHKIAILALTSQPNGIVNDQSKSSNFLSIYRPNTGLQVRQETTESILKKYKKVIIILNFLFLFFKKNSTYTISRSRSLLLRLNNIGMNSTPNQLLNVPTFIGKLIATTLKTVKLV